MDHEESENRGPETEGIILKAPGPKYPKKGQNLKVIILRFQFKNKPNRP